MDFARDITDTPEAILIDGLWGSGKSLLAPLVASLENVGTYRIDSTIEMLTVMFADGKLDREAYKYAVLDKVVQHHFNDSIAREINLRPSDDSSFLKTLPFHEILRRLVSKASDKEFAGILSSGRPYVQMTHLLSFRSPTLFEVFPSGFRLITVRRNPAFMVEHWRSYLHSFDRPREFTLSGRHEGVKVPFFAAGWADEWCRASVLERSLLAISRCSTREEHSLDALNGTLGVSGEFYFSNLLQQPRASAAALASFLSRGATPATGRRVKEIAGRGLIRSLRKKNPFRPELSKDSDKLILRRLRSETSAAVFEEFEESVSRFREREQRFVSVT